jgi:hypothetical protein
MVAFVPSNRGDSLHLANDAKQRHVRTLLAAGVVVVLLVVFALLLSPSCLPLFTRAGEAVILIPENCALTPTVPSDEMVKYLDKERIERGLVFKEWITCRDFPERGFEFMDNPHWLPSYVPATYQFRRTVIVVPYARPVPQGSPVVAEVCLMPWRKYIRQISGQSNGKFSVWK